MTLKEPLSLAEVQRRIDATPFSALLGLRAEVADAERVVILLMCRPEMIGSPHTGALHGGVIASVIDVACSYAVMVPNRLAVATVDLHTDFHRPGLGSEFVVEAHRISDGRNLAVAHANLLDGKRKLVASGRAILMKLTSL